MNEKATETAGFLDGRDYTASFLYEFFKLLVGNGVYVNELTPTATNENMTITHGSGHAWINGVCYRNTVPFILEIDTADGSLNRYDSLMVRLNLSINEAYAVVVRGDYATNPVPPACTRNAETFDLKLCDIYIPAGCTKITQAQITDTRLDASVCGVPVFPVQHLDMTTFYNQIVTDLANFREKHQADFSEWVREQEESYLATMADLVEVVRKTSSESTARIIEYVTTLEAKGNSDVAAVVEALKAFQRQGQENFNTWFETIRGQLDGDTAGRLTNVTNELSEQMTLVKYMMMHNDYFATILDEDGCTILDDDGNAIVGDWKHKYM